MIDPNLIAGAAKEIGGMVREILAKTPNWKEKNFINFYKFLEKYRAEIKRPDRDLDDLATWFERERLFSREFLKEVTSKK